MKTVAFLGKTYSLNFAPPQTPDPKPIALESKGPSELLDLYNIVAANLERKRVNKFSDKPTAVKRTWQILVDFDEVVALEGREPSKPNGEDTGTPPPAPPPEGPKKGNGGDGGAPLPPAPPPETPKGPSAERKKRGMRFVFPAEDKIKPVRPDSARGKALAVLQREGGCTFEDVQKATGWSEKAAYEGIRLLHYYSGYGMRETVKDGQTFISVFTKGK